MLEDIPVAIDVNCYKQELRVMQIKWFYFNQKIILVFY